jgi:hypothetical protein
MGGPLDTAKFNSAITRLLDLGLISAEVNPKAGQYAYHWTYVGREALIMLRFRLR